MGMDAGRLHPADRGGRAAPAGKIVLFFLPQHETRRDHRPAGAASRFVPPRPGAGGQRPEKPENGQGPGEELFLEIKEKAIAWSVGIVGPERIDEINILQATYEAMRQAISKLDPVPQVLLNDAVTIPGVAIPQVPIIKGDAKSVSIAAASIVAKVTRDRLMEEYDKVLPGYGFASNKGYGSAEHIAALKEIGPSPIHRQSFIGHFV